MTVTGLAGSRACPAGPGSLARRRRTAATAAAGQAAGCHRPEPLPVSESRVGTGGSAAAAAAAVTSRGGGGGGNRASDSIRKCHVIHD